MCNEDKVMYNIGIIAASFMLGIFLLGIGIVIGQGIVEGMAYKNVLKDKLIPPIEEVQNETLVDR